MAGRQGSDRLALDPGARAGRRRHRPCPPGKQAALVSSGDIGVYALATLAFDEMAEDDTFEVKVYPGVTAATACASLLGAPLSHDFATLSLSDLLCPWEWIEQRARAIAQADLACVLYNVQSQARQEGVYRILDILLEGKGPDTLCGVVRNAYRPEQSARICTLEELRQQRFDMLTSLVIGNRHTRRKRQWIYTPRGYHGWEQGVASSAISEPSQEALPFPLRGGFPPGIGQGEGGKVAAFYPPLTPTLSLGERGPESRP
ncbi:precorrin-3B C(17)-methyltransferase [Methylogaea oryzae]|uniref:precorrin-3B C(17)-methyltransferase n=1 Tax=Methylogaea oryzae TaxID=1295382 RepID=UPI0030D7A746